MDYQKTEYWKTFNLVETWLIQHDFKAYDPFDGLNSKLNIFTFNVPFLRQVLVQLVKRFPLNIRPYLGIAPAKSSKGIAYIARGDLLMYKLTLNEKYLERAEEFLNWLLKNSCEGYSGYCWGNHFDYQTRGYFLEKKNPTLVWTALTGRAFYDAYEITKNKKYLDTIDSICQFIITDLPLIKNGKGYCISYVKNTENLVHNANLLGAAMLSQGYKLTGKNEYREIAKKAVQYSADCQRDDGSWYYGEEEKYHWIDNWHTAYNLDSLKIYEECTEDKDYSQQLFKGYKFYRNNFFLNDGTPKYYYNDFYPLDIQCASQSIDTLLYFKEYDKDNLKLASLVTHWTVNNMLDKDGHFYQWKSRMLTNKTPTLHWGQGTMYHALANLLLNLEESHEN